MGRRERITLVYEKLLLPQSHLVPQMVMHQDEAMGTLPLSLKIVCHVGRKGEGIQGGVSA